MGLSSAKLATSETEESTAEVPSAVSEADDVGCDSLPPQEATDGDALRPLGGDAERPVRAAFVARNRKTTRRTDEGGTVPEPPGEE
ncbi:hypothetical protein [Halopelagius fulvigenes]|uniref:Uncharacterized protein n=1 Tax=Halopelagius fulvigenes TaxID=1198324 RepID=A0ABD5U1Z3_9EURY